MPPPPIRYGGGGGSMRRALPSLILVGLLLLCGHALAQSAGVTLSTTSLTVPEGGAATYTVVLNTAPSYAVTIAMGKQSGGDADLTVSPASLSFSTSNWNTARTVTVTAKQDSDTADGIATITHTATSTDSSYSGITIASVTATEDDDLGVTLSKTSLSVPEGSSATYTVVLDGASAANVTIAVAKQTGGDDNLTFSPASLTFSTTNWNTAQTVTVSAAQDGDETDGTATLTHTATSTDSDFSGLTIDNLTATEDDDDTPGVTVSTTSLTVPEGGSATYTIVLDTQPTGNVEITATPHSQADPNLTVTSGSSLTFGTTNWNTAQTVTVSAAQDNDNVNGTALINHSPQRGYGLRRHHHRQRHRYRGGRRRRGDAVQDERVGNGGFNGDLHGGA